ncbi:CU044_5270 family protein [Sphaerisporangium sp. NPDC005288]|uniref:CU044_5270 family protein n=1 Tax=Sphaerisporangium sp. NPDC005288 TaxID=3155114 RepID=UPI0033B50DB6
MADEIQSFRDGRPDAPPYRPGAREGARRRLLAQAANGSRARPRLFRTGVPRTGWQAAAAFGVTLALVGGVGVALSSRPAPVPRPAAVATAASPEPATDAVSLAPSVDGTELHPRPGQFVLVESETMYTMSTVSTVSTASSAGPQGGTHYLYRTKRKIWQSADGTARGLLSIEGLPSKPWPGESLPADAKGWPGEQWHDIAGHCPGTPDDSRTDYAYVSTLPADEAGMREHLYARPGGKVGADDEAFTAVGDLVRESYLPRAQREALVAAAKTIGGVEVAEGVEDAAGRRGTAVGRARDGVLTQLIFDPATSMYLGERGTVVDAKAAGAPVGSVLALTARLKTSVVDELPQVGGTERDSSCEQGPGTPSGGATPVQTSPTTNPSSRTPR